MSKCECHGGCRQSDGDNVDRYLLERILKEVTIMSVDVSNLQAELDELQMDAASASDRVLESLAELSAEVSDLRAQVAELIAGAVTQEQIDALAAQADSIDATIDAIDPTILPAPEPEPEPAPEPEPEPVP